MKQVSILLMLGALVISTTVLASCIRAQIACNGTKPTAGFPAKADLKQAKAWALRTHKTREIEDLQCWSNRNDRAATFALGLFYLNGIGVNRDLEKSKTMFELAAKPVMETRSYYTPPVGDQNYTIPVSIPIAKESVVKTAVKEILAEIAHQQKSVNLIGE